MTWRVFWAGVLILVGVVFLLINLGILPGNAWNYVFPGALVLLGVALLVEWRGGVQTLQLVSESAPLEGASQADVSLKHGAGRLNVHAGNDESLLFSGTFSGGVEKRITRRNNTAFLELKTPSDLWANMNFLNPRGLEWDLALNPKVSTSLKYEGGASETQMDLSGIKLTDLEINTGASSTDVVLPPPNGTMRVTVHSGAASVKLHLPPGVPAEIRGTMGLGLLDIDLARIPDRGSGVHQSDNFANAMDRIEMRIEGGVGSVQVR